LGEKRSEEPYTRRDRKLLESVAAQIGVVYENLALRDRVKKEQQVQAHVLAHLHQSQFNLVKECPHCGACYDSDAQRCAEDGYELALTLPVERTVDGRYRLERLIGKGGMGAVYQASDLRLNRSVALKVMVGSLFGNSIALRRFTREAQASAKLDHRNIVRIYDSGELRGEGAYLVLEYVPGQTWRQELRVRGVFPPAFAADALDQLLCGLDAAHQAGVVHRDLKPDNVLISRADSSGPPVVKILDFGLAKLREAGSSDPHTQSVTRYMVGTLGYASPEQMLGERIDQRTDIYAVGVMALETMTGEIESRRSYQARMEDLALRRFAFEPLHELHAAIAQIIVKCLAADPEVRYASAQDLRDALIPPLRACPPIPARGSVTPGDETTFVLPPKSALGPPAP
jgi:serine/threonine protein kinase